jgi:hypothetical protein
MAEKTPAPAKKAVRKKVTPGEPKIAAASPKPETAQPAKPETAGPETRNTKPETTKPETVPAAPPEKKKSETDEFVDYIGAPLDSWWKFIRADYREYYLRLLKLHLVRVLLQFAIIAIFAAIGIGILIGGSTLQVPGGLLGAIIVLVIAVIIGALLSMWVLQSFENAAYVLTDAQLNRKPYRMLDALGAVKGKTLRFVIVDSILQFVILLPAMLILLLPFAGLFTGSSAATLLFMMGFWLAYLFFLLY